ncbi:DUF4240 domain-containing protein [Phytohabitans suffuscus]|uniref:DUF4240 domain-containing protein n=1 Tax=Phytohabitans suffuscus TaxID=624315 RepID=A0A6F8YEE2_9ACTN|nr:DUF4240 domain-containing protein [Phytohabitans suffuscus]BCB84430.1 hypothetical protein Psuf_017430 [Phytohabitans suffuscus]
MNTNEFWALIGEAARDGGTPDTVADRAATALARRDPSEIVGFERHLRRVLDASYKVDLFGAAYLVNGGCSDEGFDAFRGWLMVQGREAFARAVGEPDSLAELAAVRRAALTGEELGSERMLGVAATAHREATGEGLPEEPATKRPNTDDFWDFDDEDEVRRRFPRLAALFNEAPAE